MQLRRQRAISVNPVDTKVRKRAAPEPGDWKILGLDAASVVTAVGPDVRGFAPGDEVFYAGAARGKIVLEGFAS